jgi:integrase
MGSIRERNGKWQAMYRDPKGAQHSQSFRSKREAERFLNRTEVAKEKGEWRDPKEGKRTVAYVAEKWLDTKVRLKPGTLRGYRTALRLRVLPTFGEEQVARIEPQDIDEWLAGMHREGVGETAVVRASMVLASVLDLAVEYRMIPVSPMPRNRPQMPDPQSMRFLTPQEIDVLASVIDPRHRTWVYAMAYTGMRWSEAAGLKVRYVHPMRRRIEIEQQLVEVAGVATMQTPKTKNGKRTIPIPKWLADLLTDQIAGKGPDDWVFTTQSGTHLRPADFHGNTWTPALKKAGLEGLRIHDLRHSHVSILIAQGEDPVTISERLGHHKPSFTMDRYAHVTKTRHEEVADRLEAFAPTGTLGATVIPMRRPPAPE